MRRWLCLTIVCSFLLAGLPAAADAASANLELEWDHLTPTAKATRNLDTGSLHILQKVSQKNNRSVYLGLTVTRVRGEIVNKEQQTLESSATGFGPMIMVRNEKPVAGKLSAAVDMSGGLIIYDKKFPAGGENYNFMWRVGPQLIYRFDKNTALNVGYMFMHVSNGLKNHNPSYNAHGVTFGLSSRF